MNAPSTPEQLNLLAADTAPREPRVSAFNETGFLATLEHLEKEVCELYQGDNAPWIIGYSGGKDSTATLQLIWNSIAKIPVDRRRKTIYVITTDTLVENPIVSAWVNKSLTVMRDAARNQDMPIDARMLTPKLRDRFWVNLIGRGYPAPRHKFRWCTERLKISPSNNFIRSILSESEEAILALGTRKSESVRRASNMLKHAKGRTRDRLSPNSSMPGTMVYTPIEDWTNDDVWFYLMQVANPWGYRNHDLLQMYAGASPDGECPLVVDDSTPSCGDSRFGCWVCTMVEKDRSMTAMIQNDVEKEWMTPLLKLRDALDFRTGATDDNGQAETDRNLRDFRRMNGNVQVMAGDRYVPGPYLQHVREDWLKRLLLAQKEAAKRAPPEIGNLELISLEELQEIRRIWVIDKHELEDSLPGIYEEATGDTYPGGSLDDNLSLGAWEMSELREICGDDRLHYELTRELLSITRKERNSARRANLNNRIEQSFKRHYFENEAEAIERARQKAESRRQVSEPPDRLS